MEFEGGQAKNDNLLLVQKIPGRDIYYDQIFTPLFKQLFFFFL
jgi:hypothetical protein